MEECHDLLGNNVIFQKMACRDKRWRGSKLIQRQLLGLYWQRLFTDKWPRFNFTWTCYTIVVVVVLLLLLLLLLLLVLVLVLLLWVLSFCWHFCVDIVY